MAAPLEDPAPALSHLSERITALTPEQRELLHRRLGALQRESAHDTRIPRQRRRGLYPLSFAQQRLWFVDAYNRGSPFYNFSLGYRIRGPLSTQALLAALAEIVRRHEALRTTFVVDGERPLQVVQPAEGWSAEVIDLTALPDQEGRELEAERWAREAAGRAFDLSRGPLFRAGLLRLAPTEHRLQLVVHHIAFDGWSIEVLVRELEALYQAFRAGQSSPLADLPIQYGDYAVWQREQLGAAALAGPVAYWKDALDGLAPLEVPADRARPAQQTYRGAAVPLALPAAASQLLAAWSRRQGVTLYMTLLAAVKALLRHRCGQNDVALGTPVANRDRPETEGLIGFFVNTLALRTDLSGDPPFTELVARVREVVLGAQAHRQVPFEKLVEELHTTRDPSRNPIVQVLFALQQASVVTAPRLRELEVSHLRYRSIESTRFDLEFHLWEADGGLEGLLIYNTDLFDPTTAGRLSLHLQELLAAVAADPRRRLSELPRMAAAEHAQVLDQWSGGGAAPPPRCVHELFAAQVERTPDAWAVLGPGEPVRFSELDRRANHLAHYLRELGVGPEVRVGLCVERSVEMVVGMLAILKAGGAYLPLDPAYPRERLGFMLEDSRSPVLLTQEPLLDRFGSAPPGRHRVCLDRDRSAVEGAGRTAPPVSGVAPENLAYVIYTSGSTGRPKGVAIPHRGAAALLGWASGIFRPEERAGVLASTSICFDLSVFEIFLPLCHGGTVVLAETALHLPRHPAAAKVTLVNTVPSAMAELVRGGALPASVRTVNLAGEPLPGPLVDEIYALGTVARVFNLYGPSEDTTYSTFAEITRQGGVPPIGRPVGGTRAYVLDPDFEPVPPGAVGELFLGGDGLARGYLDRPALTAERFVPDPLSGTPGARLYRTGDLVRYRADGQLLFLGRLDHQVKIRGFRIELGEVEGSLRLHPGVREAVAVVRTEAATDDRRLVAYVVPAPGQRLGDEELREFLRAKLPSHMVPAAFVVLPALPLNANGKIDRGALPAPEATRFDGRRPYLAPRDAFELRCAQIWEGVLGVRPVGVRDDFFELGGHSLSAFGTMARIRAAFGRDLPVSALFGGPTVEHLAGLLRSDGPPPEFSPLVRLQEGANRPPFFCVHPAGGNVLCYVGLARHLGSDQPFYGLQSRALDEEELAVRSVEEIAADYLRAVRQVQPEGPYFLGGYCLGGVFAFEMARQLQEAGEKVALLALIDTFSPAALAKEEFDDAVALSWFGRDLGMPAGKRLSIPADELRGIPAEQAFEKVLAKAKQEEVLPREAEASQLRRYFHCYLANSVAAVVYEPRLYRGRVTLLRARDAEDKHSAGPKRGWEPFTDREMDVEEVPGDHATVIFEPHLGLLADRLRQRIDAARETVLAEQGTTPVRETAPPAPPDAMPRLLPSPGEAEGTIHLRHSYTVRRPPEAVFAFLSNPRMEPKWNPWMREVRLAPNESVGEGTTFGAVNRSMGRDFDMTLRIERYAPPLAVTFRVLEGPFSARMAYSFRPLGDGMTRVDLDFVADPKDFFGLIPKALLRPLFRKSMKDDCGRQRGIMETEEAPSPSARRV